MGRKGFSGVVLLLATGCAGKPPPLITHTASLQWPPRPAQARVAYLGQIRGSADPGGAAAVIAGPGQGRQLVRPYAVTLTPSGVLVVTDPGAGQLNFFDLARQRHEVVEGFDGQSLLDPVGVAADRQNRIYVADARRRRIFVFDSAGRALRSFGGDLERPSGLALDRERGVLYVADAAAHRIHARSVQGRYLFGFGRRGAALGEFNYPSHLFFAAKAAQLLVCDTLNFRVQRFDRRGQALGALGRLGDSSGALARPKGVAADSEGNIYVVDALFNAVQIFEPGGQLLLYFGRTGRGRGQLEMPAGLFIDEKDRIFVANAFNGRVEIFRYLGGSQR